MWRGSEAFARDVAMSGAAAICFHGPYVARCILSVSHTCSRLGKWQNMESLIGHWLGELLWAYVINDSQETCHLHCLVLEHLMAYLGDHHQIKTYLVRGPL
jgi:hypothetical protein